MYMFGLVWLLALLCVSNCNTSPLLQNKETEDDDCIDEIATSIPEVISYQVQNPVKPFVGRKSELNELKASQSGDKVIVITGPKGVGTSELARQHAYDLKEQDDKISIIWINAETYETLIFSFKDLASKIGISYKDKSASTTIEEVFDFFNNRKVLFIFDNGTNDNYVINNLGKFTTRNSENIRFIVTSINNDWDTKKFKILKLEHFTKLEAKEYVQHFFEDVSDEDIEKLAQTVKYLPVALSKAASFIKEQSLLKAYSINDFVCEFQRIEDKKRTSEAATEGPHFNDEEMEEYLLQNAHTPEISSQEQPRIVYVTKTRPPTNEETGDYVLRKIQRETSRVAQQVSNEARRFGNRINENAKAAERNVRRFFQKLRNDVHG